MKIYKTQNEVEKDIKNGVLVIEGDVKFECDISIEASIIVCNGNINAGDINASNINALNINAGDINALNINAGDINASNINALNINASNIKSWDINAGDINAGDINALNINAGDIIYHAFCCVYKGIKCLSIRATRIPSQLPICLEGKLEIKELEKTETIEIGGVKYNTKDFELAVKDLKEVK